MKPLLLALSFNLKNYPALLTCCLMAASVAARGAEPAENPIFPKNAELELLHTRQVKLNSGLTEGPAVAPDGLRREVFNVKMPEGTKMQLQERAFTSSISGMRRRSEEA